MSGAAGPLTNRAPCSPSPSNHSLERSDTSKSSMLATTRDARDARDAAAAHRRCNPLLPIGPNWSQLLPIGSYWFLLGASGFSSVQGLAKNGL